MSHHANFYALFNLLVLAFSLSSLSSIGHAGNFSSCNILLNSLVNFFTATTLSALYSSAGIPSIPVVLPLFVFFSACLTSASFILCIHLSNVVCLYFVFFHWVCRVLTSTSSKCTTHLSRLAFLSFIISPLLFLTAAI